MIIVTLIRALKDNYIWCLINTDNSDCAIVDPGDASPVIDALQKFNLKLTCILITHHHWDHTNGINELLNHYQVPVYGSYNSATPTISHPLIDNQQITILEKLSLTVLTIPGHTLDHIAYYGDNKLFCGDTLFAAGCGRLFEGNAKQMYSSLAKLKNLPDDTAVYCAHEYTLANLQFAKCIEPNNANIIKRLQETKKLRTELLPTLPSTIALEKITNPFLRCDEDEVINSVKKYAGKNLDTTEEIFKHLRLWKDTFKA